MKKIIYLLILFLATMTSNTSLAQNVYSIDLLTQTESEDYFSNYNKLSGVEDMAFMNVYLPDAKISTGKFVIICPGGGYGAVAYDHEGIQWAEYFNNQGIGIAVLKYRLPKRNSTTPAIDVYTAINYIKSKSKEWNINANDIGIMGFSAGGHLASTIATHTTDDLRPSFEILFYPVITMDKTFTHLGSRKNLLGENPSQELIELYSNEKQIDRNTPSTFLVLSSDDEVVVPHNSIRFYESLQQNNIFTTMHIYPTGGHGWGYNNSFTYHQEVLHELSKWLKEITNKNTDK